MANCNDCSRPLSLDKYKKCTPCYLLFRKVNKKKFRCVDCQKEIGHQQERCSECFHKKHSGKNHPWYGQKKSTSFRSLVRDNHIGSKNPMWKEVGVGYEALHGWVKRWLKKPRTCQDCRIAPPYDLANISQEYKRDLTDWEWLCRRCHMRKDGRLKRLEENRWTKGRPRPKKNTGQIEVIERVRQ